MVHEIENAADGAAADGAQDRIVVAVVRTGGIAGLRRRWRAEPAPEQVPTWMELVDRCPWQERLDPDARGADRYVWSIHARVRDEQREQVVPDTRLEGAWRELVDAVRDADAETDADDDKP
ncbi:protealysin inhibitor emfourin [Microbacterium sp. OR21]|uniref:protealysin inhibitor emfourin n=1 Tax=Microbacterium sp. OR21 TaxID=3095346 RepID=UPI0039B5CA50